VDFKYQLKLVESADKPLRKLRVDQESILDKIGLRESKATAKSKETKRASLRLFIALKEKDHVHTATLLSSSSSPPSSIDIRKFRIQAKPAV
jgi:hypothetical protein